jgi:hypothetical protein
MVNPASFLQMAASAKTIDAVQALIDQLNITPEEEYLFDEKSPEKGWQDGRLHWYPVGGRIGNAGSIQLADKPVFPIAERTVNAHEALIELMRRRELKANPSAAAPTSPRAAVTRYFGLPPLDELPFQKDSINGKTVNTYLTELAHKVRVKVMAAHPAEKIHGKKGPSSEWSITIEDEGLGQPPVAMHSTLLSLGASDKSDKLYLVGVFGQGGSSAYRASKYSWLLSRRAPDLLDGAADGIGWTVVKRVVVVRRSQWAYLAAHPDGRVPAFDAGLAPSIAMKHGTWISHVGYDFGGIDVLKTLYRALNHLLFNPVLPYQLYANRDEPDRMAGTAYRLARLKAKKPDHVLYLTFNDRRVEQR